jgi:hypothetical protein
MTFHIFTFAITLHIFTFEMVTFVIFYRFDIPDEDLTARIGRGQGQPVGNVLESRGSVPPDLQHRSPVLI